VINNRRLNKATIDSDSLFKLFNFLNVLEIDNDKPRTRKITSLREMLNVNIPNEVLRLYMREFRQYAQDVLFGDNKERKLH
jgi:hypothetical protein